MLAVLASVCVSCATGSRDRAEPIDPPADADATTTTVAAGPLGISELQTTSLEGDEGDWSGMKSAAGRLYAQEATEIDGIRFVRLVRFDPADGTVLAEQELTDVEGWTVTPSALVALAKDRRLVTLLDPETLEVRHLVDLGEDARAGSNGDTPRSDEFWLGLRRRDVDQLQGIYTDMAAVRLDLDTGQVEERHDAPACGASSVVQLGDHLVMGVPCVEQVATLQLATGATTTYEAFPAGVSVLALGDAAFLRWKDFGYVGRLRPGDEAIQTLDLNAEGPVLSEIGPLVGGPSGVWVAGKPVDEGLPGLLTLVDPESVTVSARVWAPPGDVAFIDDVGYAIVDRRLATFDPGSVVGGVPTSVVRPDTGAPAEVQPESERERSVVDAFTAVFDARVPDSEAAPYLVDDAQTLELRTRLLELAEQLYPGVRARVTALAVGEDTASLSYVFLLDGQVAFVPLTGSLTYDGATWRVTRDTVCRLAAQAAISEC